jgi:hypothetical protein
MISAKLTNEVAECGGCLNMAKPPTGPRFEPQTGVLLARQVDRFM